MKKLFLIPLMAMLCTVMAWGATITVGEGGTYPATAAGLNSAIAAATAGDVIELTSDIAYPASPTRTDLINIDKSITLDGKGHKITGYGYCNYRLDDKETYQATHLAINAHHDKSGLNVTIKNLKLNKNVKKGILNGLGDKAVPGASSSDRYFGIGIFDGVTSLTLERDTFTNTVGGNSQIICAQGTSATPVKITMNNICIDAKQGTGYPTYFLKPVDVEMNNCVISGYCGLYFKPNLEPFDVSNGPRKYWYGIDNYGSTGSTAVANNCVFNSQNPHSTPSNSFGILALEECGITINLNNCSMDATELGACTQALFLLSDWAPLENRGTNNVLTITGDNSHINGQLVGAHWYALCLNSNEEDLYENGYSDATKGKACEPFSAFDGDIQVIIAGGTYNFDPRTYQYDMHVSTSDPHYADGAAAPTIFTKKGITIPAGYTVQEIVQDNVTLYRVTEDIQTSYDINANVPEEAGGAGENPNTNFIVQETTTLNNNETEANYVLVKEDGGNATTLTVGKADADQTLTVTNGIDVQDNAQVIVKSGSALVVENGGVITAKPENIVIEADETGAASLLLSPAVTINQTPNLTVKMTAKQVGYQTVSANKEYYWHRFALPVDHADTWEKSDPITTWLYGWNYTNNDWEALYVAEMDPFKGYTLTAETTPRQDITYTFKGKLVGNANSTLSFSRQGYNFFGNSYTGYISILKLVDQLIGTAHVDGSVWMWNTTKQRYDAVALNSLREDAALVESGERAKSRYEDWQKEVAPMQTFILRLVGAETATTELNYAEAIWGNPRYGNETSTPASAPARVLNAIADNAYMQIFVTAANGQSDMVEFLENTNRSDAYERGYDASKFMDERTINLFATVNNEDYNVLATDNLQGKSLSLQTLNDMNYTMSFNNVEGTQYAIRDLMTDIVTPIAEGNTYDFVAQPNSTVEGRFVIVPMQNMPTDVETVESNTAVKGIYTIMGQYVGEDFDILPAGVYVVDGVKIVK